MIKIFDYDLYSGYIVLNGKIVAYSLHNNKDMLIKNNPFIILIPCHRIIKEDNISGYTPLGIEFKRKLLEYEHNLLINK